MNPLTLGNVMLALPLLAQRESDDDPYVEDVNGNRVCRINYLAGATWDDDVAIAHLFAASPDLLLAAEQVVKDSEPPTDESDWEPSRIRFGSALDNLRTAIARARGEESQ